MRKVTDKSVQEYERTSVRGRVRVYIVAAMKRRPLETVAPVAKRARATESAAGSASAHAALLTWLTQSGSVISPGIALRPSTEVGQGGGEGREVESPLY